VVQVGPFELRTILGRGGIAEVWRAVHVRQDVPVALKVVTAAYARSERFLSTFRTEIQAVARLDHPGIVMVLDHGAVDEAAEEASGGQLVAGSPYLAMELASEGSLDRLAAPLAWPDLSRLLSSLLEALAHAHARGVLHRDLKPANVLVAAASDLRPGLKLTDFGIAHALGDEDPAAQQAAATLGTPAYMAPEQFFGSWRDFGPWTDLYALGCLAFTLAAGRAPFRGAHALDVARQHIQEPPPPLSSPHVLPPAFAGWVGRLLAKDPADRFARAADAAWALEQIDEAHRRATGRRPIPQETTGARVAKLLLAAAPAEPTELGDTPGLRVRAGTDPEPRPPLVEGDTLLDTPAVQPPPPSASRLAPAELAASARAALDRAAQEHSSSASALVPPLPESWRSTSAPAAPPELVGAGLRLYGLRRVPLVAREAERDVLWGALREVAATRRAQAVVVRGAAGHGKSRLVEWVAERADEVGAAIVLRATHSPIASEADGLPRLIARHLRAVGLDRAAVRERARALLERRGGGDPYAWNALTELVVPSGEASEAGEPIIRFASADERHTLLGDVLVRLAGERPVLVWIDDAQWGGDALGFVASLLGRAAEQDAAILVVLTVRDEALAERPIEAQALAELSRHPAVRTLEVPRLPRGEHRRLVEELLRLEPGLAARVAERTDGNPLFAVQLVGDWVERGVLVPTARGLALEAGEDGRIPDDIHGLWTTRIARVLERHGPDARRALELAAVLGNEVDAAEWRALAEEARVRVPPTLMLDLIGARLAEPTQQGWIFAHGMVRESIQRDVAEAGRTALLHRAAAAMLVHRHAAGVRGVAERIGRHLWAAGDARAALGPLLRAATEYWEASELEAADVLLALRVRALAVAGLGAVDPSAAEGEVLRARLDIVRGELDRALRRAAEVESSARAALAPSSLDRSLSERWEVALLGALMAQAQAVYERGEHARATNYYQQARARAEARHDAPGLVSAYQGLADTAYRLGDLAGAARLYAEARTRAEAAGLVRERAAAEWGLGFVALWQGHHGAAHAHFEAQRTLSEAAGDRLGLARAHNALGEVARLTDDIATAEREYRRSLSIHHAIGSTGTLVTRLNLAMVLLAHGDAPAAERLLSPLIGELSRVDERAHLCAAHCQLLPCRAAADDWEAWDRDVAEAEALLEETAIKDGDIAWTLELGGRTAAHAGQPVRALYVLGMAEDMWGAIGREDKRAEVAALRARMRG
jgi:tetratricopeptide (TPR) repeat protein